MSELKLWMNPYYPIEQRLDFARGEIDRLNRVIEMKTKENEMNLGKLIDRLHQEDPNREIPIELIIIPCPKDRYYNSLSHCEANEGE